MAGSDAVFPRETSRASLPPLPRLDLLIHTGTKALVPARPLWPGGQTQRRPGLVPRPGLSLERDSDEMPLRSASEFLGERERGA